MDHQRNDLLFTAEVSSRYHRRRASFLETVSTLMTLTIIVGGAGAFLSLLGGEQTRVAKWATLVVAIVGTAQALFRMDTCAVQHRVWLKQWNNLIADIRIDQNPNADKLAQWTRTQYEIEADCVMEMRALVNDCYNRTMRALNLKGQTPFRLRWYHRCFCQVVAFDRSNYDQPTPRKIASDAPQSDAAAAS